MPLSEKARIEVYLPAPAYQQLLATFEREFTYAFGGCTIIRGLSGSYLSNIGLTIEDRVNLIYTDAPFAFGSSLATLSHYTDYLREAAFRSIDEEAILVVSCPVFHSQ